MKAAKIQKRVGFHTFRHTYTTLLTQNNEEVRWYRSSYVMRTAALRWIFTLRRDCRTSGWHKSKLVRMVLDKGEALANWTKLDHDANCQFLASA